LCLDPELRKLIYFTSFSDYPKKLEFLQSEANFHHVVKLLAAEAERVKNESVADLISRVRNG
jgi:hypothetical protein